MKKRARLALGAAALFAGCLSNTDLPAGGIVNCDGNDECPGGFVCQEGRCVDLEASPTVVLEEIARAAGAIVIGVSLGDPEDGELSLRAEIVDDGEVHALSVSPASTTGGELTLTIDEATLGEGPQPRSVQLFVFADNGQKVGFDVLTLDYGNESPETNGLFVNFVGSAARANQANLVFNVRDSSSDPVSITRFEVSVDGGAFTDLPVDNTTFAEGGFEDLETSETGVSHLVNWNTASSRTHGRTVLRMTLTDDFGGELVVDSELVNVDNAPRIDVPEILAQPGRPLEDIALTYFLNAPTASGGVTVDVRVEFTMDFQNVVGLDSFSDAAAHAESGPTTGLELGDQGFRWDILESVDAPVLPIRNAAGIEVDFEVPVFTDRAALRLTAVDSLGLEGAPVIIGPFALGNDAPEVALAQIAPGIGGDIPLLFDLSDSAADLSNIEVEFRLNDQDAFRRAAIKVGNTENLAVGPTASPFLVLWASLTEPNDDDLRAEQGIGRAELDAVTVRVRTFDEPRPGIRHFSGFVEQTVALSNQSAPRIEPVLVADEGGARSGVIPVVFRIVDEESDPVHLALEFATNGSGFTAATEHPAPQSSGRLGLASSPGGVLHTFLWDSAADIPLGSTSAQLRARVIDAFIDPLTEPVANVSILQPALIETVPGADAGLLFSREEIPPSGGSFVVLGAGDFNVDGFDDVMIGNELHLADGLGGLVFEQTLGPLDRNPLVGDLNGDGVPDTLDRNRGTVWLSGAGPDLLTESVRVADCSCIFELVDIDSDGQDDVALRAFSQPVRLFLSVGAGPAWSLQEISSPIPGEAQVRSGDVDGDGAVDLCAFDRQGQLTVYGGSGTPGSGAWTLTQLGAPVDFAGRSFELGEMTGDGRADLVTYDETRLRISLHRSEGDGTFTESSVVTGLPFGGFEELVDVDGDGGLDLVMSSATDPALLLVRSATLGGRPAGALLEGIRVESVDVSGHALVVELDGDGVLDIISGEGVQNLGVLHAFFGQADVAVDANAFGAPAVRSGAERDAATPVASDLDADGVIDFFLAVEAGVPVLAEGNATGGIPTSWTTPPGGGFAALDLVGAVVGDLNGDEVADFAVKPQSGSCDLDLFLANAVDRVPTGGYQLTGTIPNPGCAAPASADLDLDGDLDVLTADPGGVVRVQLNNGDATFAASTLATGAGSVSEIRVDELTGDGLPDVIVSGNQNTVVVGRNLGGGAFTVQRTFTVTEPRHIHTGDLDADGDADLFVLPSFAATATVILAQGAGAAWNGAVTTRPFDHGFLSVARPAFADFDLDGDLDLATVSLASEDPNQIFVVPGAAGGAFGAPFEIASPVELGFLTGLDVTGDGAMDLLGAGLGGAALAVYTGRPARALRGSSVPVVEDTALGVSAFGPVADIAWAEDFTGGFADAASVGLRPIFGADDTLAGPPVGDTLNRSGDFAKLVRLEAGVVGLGAPLTGAFYASGDTKLARRADGRAELVQRFGARLDPASATDLRRAGLDLDAPAPSGLIVDLPLRPGAVALGDPIVALRTPRWRTADTVAADPLTADPEAARLLPLLDVGAGPREVVQVRYTWTLIPEVPLNQLTDPGQSGKRFAIDVDNNRIRVLTDELGAMQGFDRAP